MPFVRRNQRLSSRLFIMGIWFFSALILYLCLSEIPSFVGKDLPELFSTRSGQAEQSPVKPPPGSVLENPTSILDKSVTRREAGRDQIRRFLQNGKIQ